MTKHFVVGAKDDDGKIITITKNLHVTDEINPLLGHTISFDDSEYFFTVNAILHKFPGTTVQYSLIDHRSKAGHPVYVGARTLEKMGFRELTTK